MLSNNEFQQGTFSVKLDFFTGPMDLLLHLVRQQEVSIETVDMQTVCSQYLDVIMRSASLDLDRAAEYLVIAATLLSMKSSALLPSLDLDEDSDGFDNPEEALRFYEELRRRLLAYEETKKQAIALANRPQLGVDVFRRIDRKLLLPEPEDLAEGEDALSLAGSFAKLLKRVGESVHSLKIRLEPISIVSFMMKIVDGLGISDTATASSLSGSFREFVRRFVNLSTLRKEAVEGSSSQGGEPHARSVVIGTFIATLELMKRGLIVAHQDTAGEIILQARQDSLGERQRSSEDIIVKIESEFDAPVDVNKIVSIDSYREQLTDVEGSGEFDEGRKEVNRG